jgi:hypothetical protein
LTRASILAATLAAILSLSAAALGRAGGGATAPRAHAAAKSSSHASKGKGKGNGSSHKGQKKHKKKHKKKKKASKGVLVVCKHGCRYSTIQSAVNASGPGATIKVDPGTYVEGVIISGHQHDGLHIIGQGQTANAVVLDGKNAHNANGLAQSGIEGDNVNNLDLENMEAENYAANGFFINDCTGYLMKNLIGAFEHSYGLYVFKCIGGRMTQSVGYGNGDSAFYIGGTPFESTPVISLVDHDTAYENVLGYSGTNSKYIDIRDSEFYNNGAGVVPNTLSSEPDEPTENGTIEENLIYWNNFDYYKPDSPVKTVSGGVGLGNFNYPIGVGVIIFGGTGWTIKNNDIFGNFMWGAASFSDPTNTTGKALNSDNKFEDNLMGAPFGDANGADFWNDGSGSGTCYLDNSVGSTFGASDNPEPTGSPIDYPTCPGKGGTGALEGDPTQDAFLLQYAAQQTGQEKYWHTHSHPPRPDRTPIDGQ